MSEPAAQILESSKLPPPAAVEAPRRAKERVLLEDVCFVIKADADHLTPPAPAGILAALWERKEFASQFQSLVQRARQGEPQHFEGTFDLPPAGPRCLEVGLYPGEAAAISPVIVLIRDITERKRTEASVVQSEEHYRDLFHQTFQIQDNLRRMSDRLLKIQEHERARISRDLHDEVGQALTAINMNLAILRNALVGCAPEVERRISDTQGLIENTMDTVHNFSRELRPAMLDDLGLLPALRNYVKIFTQRTSIDVQLEVRGNEHIEALDSDRKTVIYRIVQEGLNNVVKHANATRVDVAVRGSRQNVDLEVTDNGKGFRLDSERRESAPQQLGLLGLAERARLVGGEFVVASMPERGTILRATVPSSTS